jgi:hypothetical protein
LAQVLLIHGVGGSRPESDWMKPLNARLAGMGYPLISDPPDTIRVPSYGHLFGSRDVAEPPNTYVKPSERELFRQRLDYAARQKALERLVRPYAERSNHPNLAHLPRPVVNPVAELVEQMRFEDVRRYIETPSVRHAIWREVLAEVPSSGPLIVVAHSLGSVVAAGLLDRLPPGVVVDLLITVASPLSFPRYRAHLKPLWSGFPYSRVMHWMNVYSGMDGICAGRGLADEVHQAFDVHVRVDGAHDLEAYLSHPAVAAAIAAVAFPAEQAEVVPAVNSPARPIHPSWYPLLLGTAFTCQLSKSLPSDEWRRHRRLEAAREEVARRAVADIALQRARRAAAIDQMAAQGTSFSREQLFDHPLADGRHPTLRDLTFGAASLLKGSWSDQELVPLAVGLMLQPLVSPFEIAADSRLRRDALVLTLNVVRDARGNLADQTYADQIRNSVEWAKQRLDGKGFPWGTVLIASSLALLAATGVGLAVAAPAGLVGGAVVTSTLAAFGPGGMVGGLLTLGTMTGTAGAIGGFGLAAELNDGSGGGARAAAMAAAQTGAELAAEAPETLTVTLTGMLAVVHAQLELGFESTEAFVREAVSSGMDIVAAECELHRVIAPDTAGAKLWERKLMLLKRAGAALDSLTTLPEVEAIAVTRKALELCSPPPGVQPPGRPELDRG